MKHRKFKWPPKWPPRWPPKWVWCNDSVIIWGRKTKLVSGYKFSRSTNPFSILHSIIICHMMHENSKCPPRWLPNWSSKCVLYDHFLIISYTKTKKVFWGPHMQLCSKINSMLILCGSIKCKWSNTDTIMYTCTVFSHLNPHFK